MKRSAYENDGAWLNQSRTAWRHAFFGADDVFPDQDIAENDDDKPGISEVSMIQLQSSVFMAFDEVRRYDLSFVALLKSFEKHGATFTDSELRSGLQKLVDGRKIMVQDETVYLVN